MVMENHLVVLLLSVVILIGAFYGYTVEQKIFQIKNDLLKHEKEIKEVEEVKDDLESTKQEVKQVKTELDKIKTVTVIETSGCQKGWTEYENHCYFFGLNELDWFEAQRYCHKHGSTLAKIDDATENAWISSKTNELQLHDLFLLWLGGSDLKDGQWIWMADFSPFTYVNWNKRSGEPNGGTKENCLNMLNYQTYKGTWNDFSCDNKIGYLCKRN